MWIMLAWKFQDTYMFPDENKQFCIHIGVQEIHTLSMNNSDGYFR